jgi:hypothetical protein
MASRRMRPFMIVPPLKFPVNQIEMLLIHNDEFVQTFNLQRLNKQFDVRPQVWGMPAYCV